MKLTEVCQQHQESIQRCFADFVQQARFSLMLVSPHTALGETSAEIASVNVRAAGASCGEHLAEWIFCLSRSAGVLFGRCVHPLVFRSTDTGREQVCGCGAEPPIGSSSKPSKPASSARCCCEPLC